MSKGIGTEAQWAEARRLWDARKGVNLQIARHNAARIKICETIIAGGSQAERFDHAPEDFHEARSTFENLVLQMEAENMTITALHIRSGELWSDLLQLFRSMLSGKEESGDQT